MHAHAQDINCPGCYKHFTRLGGLMSHIELTECKYFRKETLEQSRKAKEEWYANAHNARNYVAYGRTAGDFSEGPNPFSKPQPPKLVRGPNGVMLVDSDGNPVMEPSVLPLLALFCNLISSRNPETSLPNINRSLQRQQHIVL